VIMPCSDEKDYYSVTEAAKKLHKSVAAIRRSCQLFPAIGAFKIGNTWCIPRDKIDALKAIKFGPKPKKHF